MNRPTPRFAQIIETPNDARCCATVCGDKIKDPHCWCVTFAEVAIAFVERGCVGWFVHGHPDYGFPFGGAELFDAPFPAE